VYDSPHTAASLAGSPGRLVGFACTLLLTLLYFLNILLYIYFFLFQKRFLLKISWTYSRRSGLIFDVPVKVKVKVEVKVKVKVNI